VLQFFHLLAGIRQTAFRHCSAGGLIRFRGCTPDKKIKGA